MLRVVYDELGRALYKYSSDTALSLAALNTAAVTPADPNTGVGLERRRRPGQKEPAPDRSGIDETAHNIENPGNPLPLIDQQRRLVTADHLGVGSDDSCFSLFVEPTDAAASLHGRRCLSDTFRAVDQDRRQVREQVIEFVVDDPSPVLACERLSGSHNVNATIAALSTIPLMHQLPY